MKSLSTYFLEMKELMLHIHRHPCSCYELYLVFFIFSAFPPWHHFYPALQTLSLPSWRGCEKNEFRATWVKGNWYRKYRAGVQRTWDLNPIFSLVFFMSGVVSSPWESLFSLGKTTCPLTFATAKIKWLPSCFYIRFLCLQKSMIS